MPFALVIIYAAAFFAVFSTFVYLLTLYENKDNMSYPRAKKLPKVSIIVPAFNEQGRIKKTVDSLLNLKYPKHLLEIILVNDGSTDSTWNEMEQYVSKGVKIFTKKNGGKASAMNLGLAKANGEIIVSLDADSFVDKNALIRMVGSFDNPKVMSVTPSMKVWKPKSILQKIQFFEYMFGIFLRKAAAFMGCIHVTPGPFSAYRKAFFDKYGGYKKAHHTEDIEIALRIQSHNFLIENCPKAYSYTLGPSKFKPLFYQRLRWYTGFISNVIDYKHLFGKKYGVLGLFFLPSAFISVFFTIFLVAYMLKIMAGNIFDSIFNLNAINFDLLKLFSFNLDIFYLTPGIITMLTILSILLVTSIIYFARVISNDKEKIAFSFAVSLLLYAPLFALWWAVSFICKASGKKLKWSGLDWKKD